MRPQAQSERGLAPLARVICHTASSKVIGWDGPPGHSPTSIILQTFLFPHLVNPPSLYLYPPYILLDLVRRYPQIISYRGLNIVYPHHKTSRRFWPLTRVVHRFGSSLSLLTLSTTIGTIRHWSRHSPRREELPHHFIKCARNVLLLSIQQSSTLRHSQYFTCAAYSPCWSQS